MGRKTKVLLLILVLPFMSASSLWAGCDTYAGFSAFEGDEIGYSYCGGTGGGCTECIDWYPAPGVWFSVCYYDLWSGFVTCYSQGIENQDL